MNFLQISVEGDIIIVGIFVIKTTKIWFWKSLLCTTQAIIIGIDEFLLSWIKNTVPDVEVVVRPYRQFTISIICGNWKHHIVA